MSDQHNIHDIDEFLSNCPLPELKINRVDHEDFISDLISAGNRVRNILMLVVALFPNNKIDKGFLSSVIWKTMIAGNLYSATFASLREKTLREISTAALTSLLYLLSDEFPRQWLSSFFLDRGLCSQRRWHVLHQKITSLQFLPSALKFYRAMFL